MKFKLFLASLVMLASTSTQAQDKLAELEQRVAQLHEELKALKAERAEAASESAPAAPVEIELVDLGAADVTSMEQSSGPDDHVLSRPWWKNFHLSGFGAVGFYDTGSAGTRDHGGFEIKETSLFIEADVWNSMGLFVELQTNRLGKDSQVFTRTGEVYVHFRDLIDSDSLAAGIKIGRIDIPFGEEYLWQDAIDNPLITNSAAYVYGWDEGVLAYGRYRQLSFVASITDGTDQRSDEDNGDKAVTLKLSLNPTDNLYLSASGMINGSASKSAIEFGGSHFEPVGASHPSTLGESTSSMVKGSLYQADIKYTLSERAYISAYAGHANQTDGDRLFKRDFRWFGVEPYMQIGQRWYLVARYSEIGTYDRNEGYHFDGKIYAGGNSSFGYDTRRFQRLGVGAGWRPNPNLVTKFEIGKDWYQLIDGSAFSANNDDRLFVGLEVAARL